MLLGRSYSHYSLLSAIPKIPRLVETAKDLGYDTIALTDEDITSGLVEFYDACKKYEVKPILGVTLRVSNLSYNKTGGRYGHSGFSKVCLLAKNKEGYREVLELTTIARIQKEEPAYHIDLEDLEKYLENNNLFIYIPGNDHEIVTLIRQESVDIANQTLEKYVAILRPENLIFELPIRLLEESESNFKKACDTVYAWCQELGVQPIACPAARYLEEIEEEAFKVVLAIKKQTRLSEIKLDRNYQMKSFEDLKNVYAQYPLAFELNSVKEKVDIQILTNYDKNADDAFFPKFALDNDQEAGNRLVWETYIGLITQLSPNQKSKTAWKNQYPYEQLEELKKYAAQIQPDTSKLLAYPKDYWDKKSIQDYIDRIEYELDIIIKKGYPEYFLVFGDIMGFCKDNGIVTNTRGSAAGSLVGYLNNINVLDPLIYNLPFERFLNPLRPSPPDIDGDFADDRRGDVIKYIIEKYGSDRVSQIITFGTMLPRAAVKDVGRVLGVSYKKCDRLSKLIPTAPQGRKTTFKWVFETSAEVAEVYDKDPESQRIIDISKIIEGNHRHASSHAAGILITPTKLTDYAALQWDTDRTMPVAQYDMKIGEKVGLVKLDILGITNLAILGKAIELTENRQSTEIDLLNVDINDDKAFDLLAKGRTMGTFQLSSSGMTNWLVKLEPTRVEDLMAMVALYRPGPMANIPEYIERKKNPKKVTYYVPEMEEWMEPTYGILVYQEDLLLTAINIAGYDWGEADILRKGMGKKIQAVIEGQHPKFVEGCIQHGGLSKDKAEEIWQAFLPFAAYGFNKSHSASYGMVAYWTAYMKAEHTVEFMTAYMTSESNNLDRIANAIRECGEMGIEVRPPDINKSIGSFSIENDTTIRYGLDSVKNLGSDVIKFIIEERYRNGEYKNLNDLLDRLSEFNGLNKRSMEALVLAGCLDELSL